MKEVSATLRNLQMSPRKVRLVADLIRGASVKEAQTQLQFSAKGASKPVLKLLNSAIANADHNFNLDTSSLRIKTILVNEGPVLKRFMPRAFGRATTIRKRMSHVKIVLEGEEGTAPATKKKAEKKEDKKETAKRPEKKQPKATKKEKEVKADSKKPKTSNPRAEGRQKANEHKKEEKK